MEISGSEDALDQTTVKKNETQISVVDNVKWNGHRLSRRTAFFLQGKKCTLVSFFHFLMFSHVKRVVWQKVMKPYFLGCDVTVQRGRENERGWRARRSEPVESNAGNAPKIFATLFENPWLAVSNRISLLVSKLK